MAKRFFIEITDPQTNETHISEFNQGKIFHSIEACQKFLDDNFVIDDKDDFVVSHWETDQVSNGDDKNKISYLGTNGRQSIKLQEGIDIYLPYEGNDQNLVSISSWIIRIGSGPDISDKLEDKYIVLKDNKALVDWTDKMVNDLRPEAVLRLYALRGKFPVLENDNNDNDNNIHSLDNPDVIWEDQKELTEYRFITEGKKGVEVFDTKPDTGWLVKSVLTWIGFKTRISITDVLNKDRAKNVTIPAAINGKPVKSIGKHAFSACARLKNINIPNSVKTIGWGAFFCCTELTNVNIPNSVASIGSGAFDECKNLTNIVIPESVTSIGHWAFDGCVKLKNVVIPKSVISIGNRAFETCNGLEKITINATTPPSLARNVFDYNAPNRKIFVSKEVLDDYKQKWSYYKDDIFPIE